MCIRDRGILHKLTNKTCMTINYMHMVLFFETDDRRIFKLECALMCYILEKNIGIRVGEGDPFGLIMEITQKCHCLLCKVCTIYIFMY